MEMFNYMHGIMQDLNKNKTQWKEDLFFNVMFALLMLSKYFAEVTPITGMLLISAHILNPFQKLQSFRSLHKGQDIKPENETFHTTHYPVNCP
jgi:hypothetical protein